MIIINSFYGPVKFKDLKRKEFFNLLNYLSLKYDSHLKIKILYNLPSSMAKVHHTINE